MPAPDWKELAEFAVTLAEAAGKVILPHFRATDLRIAAKKQGPAEEGGYDPVTEADRAAEAAMRRLIEDAFPGHGIEGEEFGASAGDSGLTWVLDPIDGTRAFVCGLPTWTVLVALKEEGRPRIGVIHQPVLGETFLGMPSGAWLITSRGRSVLRTHSSATLATARAGTTLPDIYTSPRQRHMLATVRKSARELRYDADAYFYAMVAAGHMDLAFDTRMQPHDMAALLPVVEGAGGVVSDWSGGRDFSGGDILAAASERLRDELLEAFAATTR
jgi:myo-inositol-1(or 4)-monophosphatase